MKKCPVKIFKKMSILLRLTSDILAKVSYKVLLNVSKFQNEFMKSSLVPKYDFINSF